MTARRSAARLLFFGEARLRLVPRRLRAVERDVQRLPRARDRRAAARSQRRQTTHSTDRQRTRTSDARTSRAKRRTATPFALRHSGTSPVAAFMHDGAFTSLKAPFATTSTWLRRCAPTIRRRRGFPPILPARSARSSRCLTRSIHSCNARSPFRPASSTISSHSSREVYWTIERAPAAPPSRSGDTAERPSAAHVRVSATLTVVDCSLE